MQGDLQSEPDKRDWTNLLIICLFSLVLIAISPFFEPKTQTSEAVSVQPSIFVEKDPSAPLLSFQENTLFSVSETFLSKTEEPIRKIRVIVTAYSSTPWQTDDTPFVTAAGTQVRDGIVAANFLPLGTQIKLPEIYGDEVFVVEDRMHPRKYYQVDIWFPDYWQARDFGVRRTYVEVLEG